MEHIAHNFEGIIHGSEVFISTYAVYIHIVEYELHKKGIRIVREITRFIVVSITHIR